MTLDRAAEAEQEPGVPPPINNFPRFDKVVVWLNAKAAQVLLALHWPSQVFVGSVDLARLVSQYDVDMHIWPQMTTGKKNNFVKFFNALCYNLSAL